LLRNLATARTFHLEETTLADVQAAYKSGATTATQAYLERIQAFDQMPRPPESFAISASVTFSPCENSSLPPI